MHRLTVHYGNPEDKAEFDRRYAEEHVPMVTALDAVRSFTWSKTRALGGEGSVYMIAELDFDDAESMKATLNSPEMGAAAQHAESLGAPIAMYTGAVVDARG
jgi:uncharacterized protein (TIGR02118 family)